MMMHSIAAEQAAAMTGFQRVAKSENDFNKLSMAVGELERCSRIRSGNTRLED
jgi:hypothetical protein